jgi:stage V sporulation protein AD
MDFSIPFCGLYGACSTMALSLINAAVHIEAGAAERAIAVTSSPFCSAERQYRVPPEYCSQRPPSAQWTGTGSGAVLLGNESGKIYINSAMIGKICDLGVKDANNMGAAMAPAAADTLSRYFNESGTNPKDFDAIFTGDLGHIGSELLSELLQEKGIELLNHFDCGKLIFDRERQDVHAGGSGCGCCASVLCGYILPKMLDGELGNILFCATGALLSPTSTQQGDSIPCIAHLVNIRKR